MLIAFEGLYNHNIHSEVQEEKKEYGMSQKLAFIKEVKRRTKKLAISIISFYERTPNSSSIPVIRYPHIKSAASTASNYRTACRARSKAEFFSKMSIVVEEADETFFWTEVVFESDLKVDKGTLQELLPEMKNLCGLFAKARKNSNK